MAKKIKKEKKIKEPIVHKSLVDICVENLNAGIFGKSVLDGLDKKEKKVDKHQNLELGLLVDELYGTTKTLKQGLRKCLLEFLPVTTEEFHKNIQQCNLCKIWLRNSELNMDDVCAICESENDNEDFSDTSEDYL